MFAGRTLIATITIFAFVNKNYWKTISSVPRDMYNNIFARVVQAILVKLVQLSVIKYFTLTTVAVVFNLDPFYTLIFSSIFLKEAISVLDFALIMACFGGVCIMAYGMS